jgi:hypothetical protein
VDKQLSEWPGIPANVLKCPGGYRKGREGDAKSAKKFLSALSVSSANFAMLFPKLKEKKAKINEYSTILFPNHQLEIHT